MPRFEDVPLATPFTLVDGQTRARRAVLRKIATDAAEDDQGRRVAVAPDQEVELLQSLDLSHAVWVQLRQADADEADRWRLVLRWTERGEEGARWASLGPETTDAEPDTRQVKSQLASCLQAGGEPGQARDIYDELLDEREESALFNNRGAARAALGDVDGAIEDYSRAVELDPLLAQAYSNRGNALTKQGRYQEAIDDYDQALNLAGDVAAIYCNRGLTRRLLGDLDGSLKDLEVAISLDAEFGPSYLARGGIRAVRGDIEGAIADLERFLELSPGAPQAAQVRAALERLRHTRK